ncbi:MAG: GNAT family N-acetyltransferase [Chloroflexota bacterium]|nr:GNAT family N-acetyltransferase [Chloroflexota bacterium]
MQKLSTFGRQLLLKAKLGAPPILQKTVIDPILDNKERIRSLVQPFFDIYQLQGRNQEGPLTVTYTGTLTSLRILRKNFFSEPSTTEKTGRILVWKVQDLVDYSDSDIVVIEAGKHVVSKFSWHKAVVMPPYIHLVVDVEGSWEEVEYQLRRRKSARSEMRLARKYGYECEVSHREEDLESYYRDMYLPTIESRHDEFASPMSFEEAYQHFKQGFIFWVKRDEQYVCGNLCRADEDELVLVSGGMLNADWQLMKEGALGAMDYLNIQWANENGFRIVNFLGCEPYLKSGIFQYKRKWGSRAFIPDSEDKRIWMKIQRNTPAVAHFLKDNPAITTTKEDELQGLIVTEAPSEVDEKMRAGWEKRYLTSGLDSLRVCSVDDLI